jgi:hypothetical protein
VAMGLELISRLVSSVILMVGMVVTPDRAWIGLG